MNIKSMTNVFDDMLGSINYEDKGLYNFKVRVGVVKYRPPRHEFFDNMRQMGLVNIDAVLNHKPLKNPEELTFVFPEAHMSVHEEYRFMSELNNHPETDKIKQVDILTKSPIMVSGFQREMIVILTWEDDDYSS